jgi:hypothetical protein
MADFAFTPDAGCGMNVFFFSNQSTGQSPLTYAWNFDDPSSGAAKCINPTKTQPINLPTAAPTMCAWR